MQSKPAVPGPAVPVLAEAENRAKDVVDQATTELIARVNVVSVTAEDLSLAAAEIQKLPLETCNREARTRCLGRMFAGQSDKALAIGYRLEAMARLDSSGQIPRCWVLPTVVNECVFWAAAKQPLLFVNNKSCFEAESFVAFLLANAQVHGHA